MDHANGDKYTGDWVDDVKTGNGVYIFANGDRYDRGVQIPLTSLLSTTSSEVIIIVAQYNNSFWDNSKTTKSMAKERWTMPVVTNTQVTGSIMR